MKPRNKNQDFSNWCVMVKGEPKSKGRQLEDYRYDAGEVRRARLRRLRGYHGTPRGWGFWARNRYAIRRAVLRTPTANFIKASYLRPFGEEI